MLQSDGVSRSLLRVTIKKLRKIRADCGYEEEELSVASILAGGKHSSGDPFKDACTVFAMVLQECSELVDERNEAVKKHGQDRGVIEQSNAIMLQFRELDSCLQRIRGLVDASDAALMAAHEGGKQYDKISLLERQFNERSDTYYKCEATMKALREKNARRFKGTAQSSNQQIRLGSKNAMREQLLALRRGSSAPQYKSGGGGNSYGATGGSTAYDEGGDIWRRSRDGGGYEGAGGYRKSVRLEDDPATKEQMKRIREDDIKIEKGLDTISAGVARLRAIAEEIGVELEVQNTRLGITEGKVDKQTEQIKQINSRLTKLLKKGKPFNIFLNLFCCTFLVGLIGLMLWQFNVI